MGDTKQIAPVVPYGTIEEVVDASIMSSPLFSKLKVLHLTMNMRLEMQKRRLALELGRLDADLQDLSDYLDMPDLNNAMRDEYVSRVTQTRVSLGGHLLWLRRWFRL